MAVVAKVTVAKSLLLRGDVIGESVRDDNVCSWPLLPPGHLKTSLDQEALPRLQTWFQGE